MTLDDILATLTSLREENVISSEFEQAQRDFEIAKGIFWNGTNPSEYGWQEGEAEERFRMMYRFGSREQFEESYSIAFVKRVNREVKKIHTTLSPSQRKRWKEDTKRYIIGMEQAGADLATWPWREDSLVDSNCLTVDEGGAISRLTFYLPPPPESTGKKDLPSFSVVAKSLTGDLQVLQAKAQYHAQHLFSDVAETIVEDAERSRVVILKHYEGNSSTVVLSPDKAPVIIDVLKKAANISLHLEAYRQGKTTVSGTNQEHYDGVLAAVENLHLLPMQLENYYVNRFISNTLLRGYFAAKERKFSSVSDEEKTEILTYLHQDDNVTQAIEMFREQTAAKMARLPHVPTWGDLTVMNVLRRTADLSQLELHDFSSKYAPLQWDCFKLFQTAELGSSDIVQVLDTYCPFVQEKIVELGVDLEVDAFNKDRFLADYHFMLQPMADNTASYLRSRVLQ